MFSTKLIFFLFSDLDLLLSESSSWEDSPKVRSQVAQFTCCGKTFSTKSNLTRHEKDFHNEEYVVYRCTKCTVKKNREDEIKRHSREKHDGSLSYTVNIEERKPKEKVETEKTEKDEEKKRKAEKIETQPKKVKTDEVKKTKEERKKTKEEKENREEKTGESEKKSEKKNEEEDPTWELPPQLRNLNFGAHIPTTKAGKYQYLTYLREIRNKIRETEADIREIMIHENAEVQRLKRMLQDEKDRRVTAERNQKKAEDQLKRWKMANLQDMPLF